MARKKKADSAPVVIDDADDAIKKVGKKLIDVDGELVTVDEAFGKGMVTPESHPELFDDFCNRL